MWKTFESRIPDAFGLSYFKYKNHLKQNRHKCALWSYLGGLYTKSHPTTLPLHGLDNVHLENTTIVSLRNIFMKNDFEILLNMSMSHEENRGLTPPKLLC